MQIKHATIQASAYILNKSENATLLFLVKMAEKVYFCFEFIYLFFFVKKLSNVKLPLPPVHGFQVYESKRSAKHHV